MCKSLKTKWSGRVDSNHRPPGPEPWESLFCRLLEVFAGSPYRAVSFMSSMTSRFFSLHRLVLVCRLSRHQKGKKRATCGKCLILSSLIRATLWHLIAVGQAQIERLLRQAIKGRLSESEHGARIEHDDPVGAIGISEYCSNWHTCHINAPGINAVRT
jgi:hypothetical protein